MAYVETTAVWFLNTLNLYASVGYVSMSLWIKKREEEQEKKEEATVVWPPEAHVTVHKDGGREVQVVLLWEWGRQTSSRRSLSSGRSWSQTLELGMRIKKTREKKARCERGKKANQI